MNGLINKLSHKIYSTKLYERFITFQNKTVGKWQTNLLKRSFYWRWHSTRHYNTIHWTVLAAFTIGIFVGVMSPFAAPKQPGRGQEFELIPPSSENSIIIASPQLLTANGTDKSEIEITLLDANLNPLGNRNIELITQGDGITLEQPQATTSNNGVLYAYLSSTSPGTKTVLVKDIDAGVVLVESMEVEFTNNIVHHWTKPGTIDPGAATTTALDTAGNYRAWTTDAIETKATMKDKFIKEPLRNDSCSLLENSIYCSGGKDEIQNKSDNFYKIDIFTGEKIQLENLPYAISNHQLMTSGQSLYLVGGNAGESPIKSVYQYDPGTDVWQQISSLNVARENFELVKIENTVCAIGGYTGENQTNSLEKLTNGSWTALTGMGEHRNLLAAEVWGNKIYVFGGWDGKDVLNSGEVYDPKQDKWFKLTPMPSSRWAHEAILHQDKIYIFGGYNSLSQSVTTVDIFDPATNSWTTSDFKFEESGFSLISIADRILTIGGNISPSIIKEYTPEKFTIKISENNNVRRAGAASTQFEVLQPSAQGGIINREIEGLNLSNTNNLKLQIYSSRPGNLIRFLMGETTISEQALNITINNEFLWNEIDLDISTIPEDEKDNIRYLGFEVIDASEPFTLNVYDIWTEGELFTTCPCERDESMIFTKTSEQDWGKLSWVTKDGPTSTTEIFIRNAQSLDNLPAMEWISLPHNLSGITNDFIELKFVLREEEVEWLPQLYSVSLEVVTE